ncbi:hypothetical protein [Comamonas odontotermitis]|uniref:hypothetical protein n=1 Tax=Comamonas odontotermitis TaxID=379895 RepID=UPI001CC4F68F|nr:hypothetical protein [Comamonas odontotermitis]UBB15417.1 hypothetical protein LAD35_11080 [Comamonas odontotermitis]
MLTFADFTGINNLQPGHRLTGKDLIAAENVDIGLTGEITRRGGFALADEACHKNLHQAQGYMLATCGSVLMAIWPDGARHVIHPALGSDRVWYCDLPDGRTTYTNGLIHGVTDGRTGVERSVPVPESLGLPDTAFGQLDPGDYRYSLSYVRITDRLEGPAISSAPVAVAQGGLRLGGLPVLFGYAINVYLSGKDGEGAYLAGTTTGSSFEYGGNNASLVLPCRTLGAEPFPVGTITAFWRGRVLVAQGNVLWASRPSVTHLSDWRDFKQLAGKITAIQPVDDGVYVGTDQDLIFLSGTTWDQLAHQPTKRGPVVLGSGVSVRGDRLKFGDGAGTGMGMVCIAGGEIVAGFNGGQTSSLTANRYRTTVKEVCATWREVDGIPQYVAATQ